jgi:uncharacterized protein (TIGR03067 family)
MRTSLIVLAALVLGFAPAPLPRRDRARDGRDRLEGVWYVKAIKFRDQDHWSNVYYGGGLSFFPKEQLTISGGELTFADGTRNPRRPARWTIQAHGGTHDLDLEQQNGPTRMLGIYRLEEGALSFCLRPTSSGRPRAFSRDEFVIVLTRHKP